MAHITKAITAGNPAVASLAVVTFTSYTQGGDTFTLAEFGLTGTLANLFFLQTLGDSVPGASGNGAQYLQYVGDGVVKIMRPDTPSIELPTVASMVFSVLVVVITTAAQ
jgi:hypothetical protein